MDSYPGQGIDTLRSALIHSYSLPILMHIHFIEEGLDWFMPRAHCHCASNDSRKWLHRHVLTCHLSSLGFLRRDLHRDGKVALINLRVMSPFPTYWFPVPCVPEVTVAQDEQERLPQQMMK